MERLKLLALYRFKSDNGFLFSIKEKIKGVFIEDVSETARGPLKSWCERNGIPLTYQGGNTYRFGNFNLISQSV